MMSLFHGTIIQITKTDSEYTTMPLVPMKESELLVQEQQALQTRVKIYPTRILVTELEPTTSLVKAHRYPIV